LKYNNIEYGKRLAFRTESPADCADQSRGFRDGRGPLWSPFRTPSQGHHKGRPYKPEFRGVSGRVESEAHKSISSSGLSRRSRSCGAAVPHYRRCRHKPGHDAWSCHSNMTCPEEGGVLRQVEGRKQAPGSGPAIARFDQTRAWPIRIRLISVNVMSQSTNVLCLIARVWFRYLPRIRRPVGIELQIRLHVGLVDRRHVIEAAN
jgi:hypothetical protein